MRKERLSTSLTVAGPAEASRPTADRPKGVTAPGTQGRSRAGRGAPLPDPILLAKVALQAIIDAVPELIALVDGEWRIERLNQALARRLAQPIRELIGQGLPALFPWWPAALAPPAGGSDGTSPGRLVLDSATGDVYEVRVFSLGCDADPAGERLVMMRNVTGEEEAKRQLIAAERRAAVGDLLQGIAHEVRNPLTAIQAAVETLRSGLSSNGENETLLSLIGDQVRRLSVVMQRLLMWGQPIQPARFRLESLPEVCEVAIRLWRQVPGNAGRSVRLVAPEHELSVRADAARLEQALINLFDNAHQHAPSGTDILVKLLQRDGAVSLQVSDHGPGIHPDHLARIFEPFFTTRNEGTGLGLGLVRNIMEDHGGRVSVWNNAPGPGCTFEVTLPVSATEGV